MFDVKVANSEKLNETMITKWGKFLTPLNETLKEETGSEVSKNQLGRIGLILETLDRQVALCESAMATGSAPVQVANIGNFRKHAFPIITAVFGTMIAEDLVSIQPLTQKTGQIFALEYVYGTNKGKTKKGGIISGLEATHPDGYNNINYSASIIEDEILVEALGTGKTLVEAPLSYFPVLPGTIVIDVNGVKYNDRDGKLYASNGTVVADSVVDYASGKIKATLPGSDAHSVVVDYEYDNEYSPTEVPTVEVRVVERTVTAKTRKIRTVYAFNAGFELKMQQGIDIDEELLRAVAEEIKFELDGEVCLDLLTQAGGTSTWNIGAKDSQMSLKEYYEEFIAEINSASNGIFQKTRRAVGNRLVLGKTNLS